MKLKEGVRYVFCHEKKTKIKKTHISCYEVTDCLAYMTVDIPDAHATYYTTILTTLSITHSSSSFSSYWLSCVRSWAGQ